MKTEFNVTYQKDGVRQAMIIVAETKELAERWFRFVEPRAMILGVRENFDYKPRKPIEEVPDNFDRATLSIRRYRTNDRFNEEV